METATEFAAGKGNPDYPLLRAAQSPASRVPCVDFSPWLNARLATGDADAAASYLLQIVAANPGIAASFDFEDIGPPSTTWRSRQDESWMRTWRGIASELLDIALVDLECISSGPWQLDLRTALIVMCPLQSPVSIVSLNPDVEHARTLAALMSCHDIRLRAPDKAVRVVNAKQREWKKLGSWDWPDLTVADVTPPRAGVIPPGLADLPLGTRSHLLDIDSSRRIDGPSFAGRFSTFYRTKQLGCDDEQSFEQLLRHGVLRTVNDSEIEWRLSAHSLTIPQLLETLGNAGIRVAKSSKKAVLIEASRSIKREIVAKAGKSEPIYEITPEGAHMLAWIKARSSVTMKMWAAWACQHDRHA
ncbi:hypothetical protein ACWPKO_28585 (plasmid) [Coraliomargarita sp. W4R53]